MHDERFHPMGRHTEATADELTTPNTSIADYVWLPLRFEIDGIFIDWVDEWRVEDFD